MASLASALWARCGDWRADVLWRLLGVSMFELVLLHAAHIHRMKAFYNYGLHWLLPAGLVLMFLGARPIALLASGVLAIANLVNRLNGSAEVQVAEELALYTTLPVLGLLAIAIARYAASDGYDDRERTRQEDEHQVLLFRVAAATTLTWATLHKLNVDFFNAAYSCAPLLASEITHWWSVGLPDLIVHPSPLQIVVFEALCVVLLLTFPRIGIVWTGLVIGVIGLRGATAFAMLAVLLAFSFVEHDDGARLAEAWRKYWKGFVSALVVAMLASSRLYAGPRPWPEVALMQIVIVSLIAAAVALLASGRGDDERTFFERVRERCFGAGRYQVMFAIGLWVIAVLNGAAPYAGLKYRMSFAMLSNLRVDDTRWNSYLFPKALRVGSHDEFVHVEKIQLDGQARSALMSLNGRETRGIRTGLLSPMSLEYRMRFVRFYKMGVDLDLTYKGERYAFKDAGRNPEFKTWIDGLPMSLMIQDALSGSGPQPCTH